MLLVHVSFACGRVPIQGCSRRLVFDHFRELRRSCPIASCQYRLCLQLFSLGVVCSKRNTPRLTFILTVCMRCGDLQPSLPYCGPQFPIRILLFSGVSPCSSTMPVSLFRLFRKRSLPLYFKGRQSHDSTLHACWTRLVSHCLLFPKRRNF